MKKKGFQHYQQKTRPLIGMINIEEEIKILESTADNANKDFQGPML